jgi:cell division transport system permease protein
MRIGGIGVVAILSFVSFIVLLTIISMRLSARKDEIEILNLIGATQKFIRSPIIAEALIYTYLGVFLGSLSAFVVILYMSPSLYRFFGEISFLPDTIFDTVKFFGLIFMAQFFVGTLIAYLGGFLAVNRAKKVR